MKKTILLIITASFIFCNANSQITKGNWLVGGNATFSSQTEKINSIATDVISSSIVASPNIGYFIFDKFAGGARISVNYNQIKYNGSSARSTNFGIGPFLRYYFLKPDARVNVFAESAYQYITITNNSTTSTSEKDHFFAFSAGPVIYFNSTVGIEFTAGYQLYNGSNSTNTRTVSFNIGFQIHLEK